jgi:PAS domain S-box-containing protein
VISHPVPLVQRFGAHRIPLMFQLVSASVYALCVVVALAFRQTLVTDLVLVGLSAAVMAIAIVLSAVIRGRHGEVLQWLVGPFLTLLSIGLLRAGTGAMTSIFTPLVVLPMLMIAARDGRRWIALALAAVVATILLPFALELRMPADPLVWLESLTTPLVLAVTAILVNAFAGQARRHIASIGALADERVRMLEEAVATSAALARTADRLLAADQFTRGVLDAVTEQSVIGTDLDGLIDVWNPGAERLLRLSPHETQGHRHVHEFHDPHELESRKEQRGVATGYDGLIEVARQGRAEVLDWTYRRDDGTTVPVRVAVTPRLDREGVTIGFIFVATDITELLASARLKDEFISLISHELRTPLSSILGYLELLRDDEGDPLSEEQLSYLAVAERNAHRLLRLVGELLFTAQIESGQLSLAVRDMDLGGVLRASVESASPTAASAGVHLHSEAPTDPVHVVGDPVRLGQACDNLISNAVKFTPRGGDVTVALSSTGGGTVISVRDTGLGIPAHEVDKLYERFFRASTAVRNAVPGIGLGLSITKGIVEAHGGTLDVSSEEGVGTVFSITLPAPAVLTP